MRINQLIKNVIKSEHGQTLIGSKTQALTLSKGQQNRVKSGYANNIFEKNSPQFVVAKHAPVSTKYLKYRSFSFGKYISAQKQNTCTRIKLLE